MGGSQSAFSSSELELYQDLTYFTKKEILHAFQRFVDVAPNDDAKTRIAASKAEVTLPVERIVEMPELRVNPFRCRLCRAFSPRDDGSLTFEDFLDMMSVMSDRAPKSLKTEYAFRVYDFDEDDMIGAGDIAMIVDHLLGDEGVSDTVVATGRDDRAGSSLTPEGDCSAGSGLAPEEKRLVVKTVIDEADLDDDRKLSFAEFEHVISKAPDFMTSFRIRL